MSIECLTKKSLVLFKADEVCSSGSMEKRFFRRCSGVRNARVDKMSSFLLVRTVATDVNHLSSLRQIGSRRSECFFSEIALLCVLYFCLFMHKSKKYIERRNNGIHAHTHTRGKKGNYTTAMIVREDQCTIETKGEEKSKCEHCFDF